MFKALAGQLKPQIFRRTVLSQFYSTPGATVASSVPHGKPLKGLNYKTDQEEIVAKEDSEYPAWLWTLLDKIPEDQLPESKQLKLANRRKIKQRNFVLSKKK